MVTLSEIATQANVSKAAVSLVLNNKAGVSAEKREEIWRIIKETGYQVKNKKNQGVTHTIRFIKYKEKGFMVNQNGDFISRIVDGIEYMARKNNFALAMTNLDNTNIEAMVPEINEENDVGIIFLATEFDMEKAALLDLAERLKTLPADTTDGEIIQGEVYAVGKAHEFEPLRAWFQALYEVLLGASQGPRFGSFAAIYGLSQTIELLEKGAAGGLVEG